MDVELNDGAPRLEYPCAYPVKVFMHPDEHAESGLVASVQDVMGSDAPVGITRRHSKNGRYLCLTLQLRVQSAAQAERLAAVVRNAPGVVMAL